MMRFSISLSAAVNLEKVNPFAQVTMVRLVSSIGPLFPSRLAL